MKGLDSNAYRLFFQPPQPDRFSPPALMKNQARSTCLERQQLFAAETTELDAMIHKFKNSRNVPDAPSESFDQTVLFNADQEILVHTLPVSLNFGKCSRADRLRAWKLRRRPRASQR